MGYYYAEDDHMGGGNCGHRHRTHSAARRCLPKLPPGRDYYSRARVRFVPEDNASGLTSPGSCHTMPDPHRK